MADDRESMTRRFTNILRGAVPAGAGTPEPDPAIPWADPVATGAPLQLGEDFAQEDDDDTGPVSTPSVPDVVAASISAGGGDDEGAATMIDTTGYAFELPASVLNFGIPIDNRADAFAAMIAIRRHDPRSSRQIAAKAGLAPGDPCHVLNDGIYPSDGMLKKYCQLYRIPLDISEFTGRNIDDSHYEGRGHDYKGPPRPGTTPAPAGGITLEQHDNRGTPTAALGHGGESPHELEGHRPTTSASALDTAQERPPAEPTVAAEQTGEADGTTIHVAIADAPVQGAGDKPAEDPGTSPSTAGLESAAEQAPPEAQSSATADDVGIRAHGNEGSDDDLHEPDIRSKGASAVAAITRLRDEKAALEKSLEDAETTLRQFEQHNEDLVAELHRERARAEAAEAQLEAISRALEE